MDLLYSDMAQLLREHAREDDLPARFSDTVLLLIMRGTTHEERTEARGRDAQGFEDKIFEAAASRCRAVSIGMVLIGEKIANADAILGNGVELPEVGAGRRRQRVEGVRSRRAGQGDAAAREAARRPGPDALKNNGFVLFFQPIISLHGAEGEFYEILLRMIGAQGEQLMPASSSRWPRSTELLRSSTAG
jgi:hypothetical protein